MQYKITAREVQVLELIAYENNSREIGKKLRISHHTAMTHRKKLMEKLSVRNAAGLVRRGYELGLLTLSSR